jgi:molecular chaperone GrpE (heat shock protein)
MENNLQLNDEFLADIKKTADALHAKIEPLQAKCDRYEAKLTSIQTIANLYKNWDEDSIKQSAFTIRHLIKDILNLANKALSGEGEVARKDIEDGKEMTKHYQGIENAIGFATWLSENGYIRFKGEEWICINTKKLTYIIELYSAFHDIKEAYLSDYYETLNGLSENIKPGL